MPNDVCYYAGIPYSEGTELCMEGLISVCREGEWKATGTPCGASAIEKPTGEFTVFTASEEKITESRSGVSKALFEVRDCQTNVESDIFETRTGQIRVSGLGMPAPAKYEATQLRAVDGSASYDRTNGYHTIKPGKYKHMVKGQIPIWGPCQNKLWVVQSEVYYD